MIATIIQRAVMQGTPLLFGSTGEILTEKSGQHLLVGLEQSTSCCQKGFFEAVIFVQRAAEWGAGSEGPHFHDAISLLGSHA